MNFFLIKFLVWNWLLVCANYGRVYELFTRDHLHDMLLDTPLGNRPSVVVAIYNDTKQCVNNLNALGYDDTNLPTIEHLILFKYEMSTLKKRIWHDYEKHLDFIDNLPTEIQDHIYKNSNNDQVCPTLLYLSVNYSDQIAGHYLTNPIITKNDYSIWNPNIESNWKQWVWSNLKLSSIRIVTTLPFDCEITLIPHAKNPFYKKKKRIVHTISSYLSYQYIYNVYVGDRIYVSKNPTTSHENQQLYIDARGNIVGMAENNNNDNDNPKITIIPGDNRKYFLKYNFENNKWFFEIDKHRTDLSEELIKSRHITTYMNHGRNLILPLVVPYFHSPGFKKIKMPPGLHERLMKFYRTWYHLREAENWDDTSTQLNFLEQKSHMINLDHNFTERNIIAEEIVKPILEEWSGYSLEFTAFYGLREYSRGAVLSNHVDRSETHIFSAILQIAQADCDENWELEVIGLDGHYYRILLEPGEIILYEGATLPHGRPKPFSGTMFTNAFCHYRPINWNITSTSKLFKTPKAIEIMQQLHVTYEDLNIP